MAQTSLNSTGVASSGALVLQSNGTTTAVTIDTAQNVGVGVTPSAWTSIKALQVVNASFGGLGGGNYSAANAYYDGTNWKYITSNYATLYQQSGNSGDGVHKWNVAASGTAGNAISFTQAMTLDPSGYLAVGPESSGAVRLGDVSGGVAIVGARATSGNVALALRYTNGGSYLEGARIDSSGNLGVGTSSPFNPVGSSMTSATINGSTYGTLYVQANGGTVRGTFNATTANNTVNLNALTNHPLTFSTNDTERARIDSSGNLLVGTTTASSIFTVTASRSGNYLGHFSNTANSGTGDQTIRSVLGSNGNNTSNYHFVGTTGGSDKIYIFGNGNIQNSNNSYGAISDAKLKENIVDAAPKLAQLSQVRVVNYNLIGDTQKQIGVVAQELEQVFPGMVEENLDYADVVKTREVIVPAVLDEEGNEVIPATTTTEEYTERELTGSTTKSVKYSVFVPMLIKAMQEQQTIIEALRADVEALKAK